MQDALKHLKTGSQEDVTGCQQSREEPGGSTSVWMYLELWGRQRKPVQTLGFLTFSHVRGPLLCQEAAVELTACSSGCLWIPSILFRWRGWKVEQAEWGGQQEDGA